MIDSVALEDCTSINCVFQYSCSVIDTGKKKYFKRCEHHFACCYLCDKKGCVDVSNYPVDDFKLMVFRTKYAKYNGKK
jgi:hypothetical protein